MFLRMLRRSFTVGYKAKLLAVVTIAFGASLATAMLNVSLDVGDKVNRELKTYGANLMVLPQVDTLSAEIGGIDYNPLADRGYLEEESLLKLKTIFWAYNIVGFTPYLEATAHVPGVSRPVPVVGTWVDKTLKLPTGETAEAGVKELKPWWAVEGNWMNDEAQGAEENGALLGRALAEQLQLKPGGKLDLQVETKASAKPLRLKIAGIVDSGGEDDDKIIVPLAVLQEVMDLSGKVGKVEVSALTTPENDLARRAARNPEALSAADFEVWYCTAYVSSIAYQIEEAIPGSRAKAILQVSESEGIVLSKIQFLMLLLTVAALISSGLGISGLMTTKVLERSREIGLMKAIGAQNSGVVALFMVESVITGIIGGALGYGIGLGFSHIISESVFGSPLHVKGLVLPLVLLLSVAVTLAGSFSAMRMVFRLRPAHVLRGGQ